MVPSPGVRWSSDLRRLSCRCVVTMWPGTASIASPRSPIRCAWPTSMQMPTLAPSRSFSMNDTSDSGVDSGLGMTSSASWTPARSAISCSASTLRRAASRLLSEAPGFIESGTPRWTTRCRYGIVCAIASAASASASARRRRSSSATRIRERLAPLAVDEAGADRRVDASSASAACPRATRPAARTAAPS